MIRVAIRDEGLAGRMTEAIERAIRDAAMHGEPPRPVVAARSRKRIAALGAQLDGAIALVTVTPRNARRLIAIVEAARAAGAAGIQLVWDGAPATLERHVFAVLEHARASPHRAPVLLAPDDAILPALGIVIAHRSRKQP